MEIVAYDLPPQVHRGLHQFIDSARSILKDDLRSVVLYGSAAEGRLRPTSDLNLILVLSAFYPARLDGLREPLAFSQAAIQLAVMFLLQSEIPSLVEAFPVKVADILRRRRILHGPDPFADIRVSPAAEIARLKQVLLNLKLRFRERYLSRGLRKEQLIRVVAGAAGPLRSAAASLLELAGRPGIPPREALKQVASSFDDPALENLPARISEAREKLSLPSETAGSTVLDILKLVTRMEERARSLRVS